MCQWNRRWQGSSELVGHRDTECNGRENEWQHLWVRPAHNLPFTPCTPCEPPATQFIMKLTISSFSTHTLTTQQQPGAHTQAHTLTSTARHSNRSVHWCDLVTTAKPCSTHLFLQTHTFTHTDTHTQPQGFKERESILSVKQELFTGANKMVIDR